MSDLHNPTKVAAATGCPAAAVNANLELILTALQNQGILSSNCAVAALATVAIETAHTFQPIHEFGDAAYFTQYDGRADLGNVNPGDGYLFRGRGFVQLTGRLNYTKYGAALHLDLVGNPELACEADNAAKIIAYYFYLHGTQTHADAGEWQQTRKDVNGGLGAWADYWSVVQKLLVLAGEN